ncbi:MAG: tRNA 2-thiouridine(34) synthase MnmA [Bergeyella sp.]|nr:tRNA 2-thiouridine(34) synthase MnmA [Bergeyella sp.]
MKIAVGLSGGVDSSVVAYLLKQQGHDVIGVFMRNWNDASVTLGEECPWVEDSHDALLVAKKLGIPFQVVDMSEHYKETIVDYMFSEYRKGRTPNPDVLCNREVKFKQFLDTALSLGVDKVATGHYARVEEKKITKGSIFRLLEGVDADKDQSYFLCQLNQYQLSKALFPVGSLTKPEVRMLAKGVGLPTAEKKDSQGLCFIGKVSLPKFLKQQLAPKKGDIIEIFRDFPGFSKEKPTSFSSKLEELRYLSAEYKYQPHEGKKIGEHQGAHYYTVGQSRGLGIGGHKESCFVLYRDVEQNVVYVGEGHTFPGLYRKALKIAPRDIHWIRPDLALKNNESQALKVRIRYRQKLEDATLYQYEEGLFIEFDAPQSAVAKGQFAAWYLEEELLGSGVIS